ncbi:MAG: molybdate ABC transporter substrate-binding protein [Pseudomonadota bacterium]
MIRFFIVTAMLFLYCSPTFAESPLLAAGAGYKRPLSEIVQAYEASGGAKIDQVYGNMGQVLMQAKASGNMALIVGEEAFLKASSDLEFSSFLPIGEGVLVIAYGKKIKLQQPEDLLKPEVAKVAIPDEKHAIYGKAGKEFLRNTELLDKLRQKLLVVSTVPQVTAYLISGEVEAGFINLTDALYVKDKIGGYLIPDPKTYSPIRLVLGVIKGHEENPDVKKFLGFLKADPKVAQILKKSGL